MVTGIHMFLSSPPTVNEPCMICNWWNQQACAWTNYLSYEINEFVRFNQIRVNFLLLFDGNFFSIVSSFIPEFVSRLPTITALLPLEIADLFRILTEVNGSLVSQYTTLFGYSGVEIRFTSSALREICRKAYERGGGARGLKAIMVCF